MAMGIYVGAESVKTVSGIYVGADGVKTVKEVYVGAGGVKQVWPSGEKTVLDATDSNPNGWTNIGGSAGYSYYENGSGAVFVQNQWSYWSYNDDISLPFTDMYPVGTTSYTGTSLADYTQVQITFTVNKPDGSTLRFGYQSSSSDYYGTALMAGTTITNSMTGNTYTYTYTLQNKFTSAPYRLGVGVTAAKWYDGSERWQYNVDGVTVSKIEFL